MLADLLANFIAALTLLTRLFYLTRASLLQTLISVINIFNKCFYLTLASYYMLAWYKPGCCFNSLNKIVLPHIS